MVVVFFVFLIWAPASVKDSECCKLAADLRFGCRFNGGVAEGTTMCLTGNEKKEGMEEMEAEAWRRFLQKLFMEL